MKIYTTVEPVPSRILAVTRLLLMVNNPLSKDEFLSMLQPKSTNPSGAGVSEKTIDAAVECGLIERKDDLYMLATNILPKETKPEDLDSCLPRLLAKLVIAIMGLPSFARGYSINRWTKCLQTGADLKMRSKLKGFR
jgi:hypothetical protein